MLQHNTMKLFESHGNMCSQVLDTEMVEPFALGETPAQTAQKLQDRANHLRTLFQAVHAYAHVILDDTAHSAPVGTMLVRDASSVLESMEDDIKDLAGLIEKMADRTAPDAVLENAPDKPVRIKELIAEHYEDLAGKDYAFLINWARNHGIRDRGMPAFWSEFTVAIFTRNCEINRRIDALQEAEATRKRW